MNKKIYYLVKRDVFLIVQHWKRFFLYLLSICVLDVLMIMNERYDQWYAAFAGVSVKAYLNDPSQIPVQWIWGQIGIVLISMDMVKKDLYQIADCLLPHIKRKSYFWYSKEASGLVTAVLLAVLICIEKSVIFLMTPEIGLTVNLTLLSIVKASVMQCLGIYTLYGIYILLDYLLNEMAGLLVCVIYVLFGLPFGFRLLYCNAFMFERGNILSSLCICFGVHVIVLLTGKYVIDRSDILKR